MNNIDDLLFRNAVIYIVVFIFVLVWNWVFWQSLGDIRKELVTGVADFSRSIMEPFDYHNTTWFSAEDQDRRWEAYKQYYTEYQHRLRQTNLEYYVVYTTTNSGLANKLNGLVSSLLVAMVTDRGLLRFLCLDSSCRS